jgi:hypothetical protein
MVYTVQGVFLPTLLGKGVKGGGGQCLTYVGDEYIYDNEVDEHFFIASSTAKGIIKVSGRQVDISAYVGCGRGGDNVWRVLRENFRYGCGCTQSYSQQYWDGIFKFLRIPGIDFASRCSPAGLYVNPIPSRFLTPIDGYKMSALEEITISTERTLGWNCTTEGPNQVFWQSFLIYNKFNIYGLNLVKADSIRMKIAERKLSTAWSMISILKQVYSALLSTFCTVYFFPLAKTTIRNAALQYAHCK